MADLERAVAKLFCVGFSGSSVPKEMEELIDRGVSGAILFARNVESAPQVASLGAQLKQRASRPFLVSIDQEGGRVRRLREGFSPMPSMRSIGAAGDPRLARAAGAVLGRELRAVNVDLDYAPVLDVDTNPDNPVIGDRAFSSDPAVVARLGAAMIQGLQRSGVAACGKHFPGHGDTIEDSHLALPRLPHPLERLEEIELLPFRAAIWTGVAAIMSAHVVFEALDPDYPATMSRKVLDGILRDRMAFDGALVSDDLEMNAIAENFGWEEAVVRGVLAGVDLFLVCHRAEVQHEAIDALVAAVRRGDVPRSRIDEAGRRVDALVARFVQPPVDASALEVLACKEHLEVIDAIRRQAGRLSDLDGPDPTAA